MAIERKFPEGGDFPIEFSGSDPNGHHAAYFVKPEDAGSSKYRLDLKIRNVRHETLSLPKITPTPSDYHLRLRFRPALVDGRTIRKAMPLANELEQQLGKGWKWHDLGTDENTGQVGVCFSYAPAEESELPDTFEWNQGQTLTIQLRPFKDAPLSGAFFLKMELDYSKLPVIQDANYEFKVRELNLAVVDLSGKTFFPGKAAVLGSNTILNNGQPNSRTIRLWNAVQHSVIPFRAPGIDHESGSTITVAIRCLDEGDGEIANHPSVLGTKNELSETVLEIVEAPSDKEWDKKPHSDVPGWLSWEVTPKPETGITEIGQKEDGSETALEFKLTKLASTAPDGVANVYLHFHHLPGYADHTLIVPLEKTPLVVRGRNVGVGVVPEDDGNSNIQSAGRIQDKTGYLMPVGAIIAYVGRTAPPGWLYCNGREISREKYPDLYNALPADNKKLPDLRSRFIIGAGQGEGKDHKLVRPSGGGAYVGTGGRPQEVPLA